MAFRIKPHKSATKEVRRIALERLLKAQQALLLPSQERARGIHQARKRIKEARALVRLVRTPMGKHYRQENRRLRDINRRLSAMRDAGALVETWDALAGLAPEQFATAQRQAVRKKLVLRSQDGGLTVEESHRLLGEALVELAEAEETVGSWPLQGKGFSLLRRGLARSFDDGRSALAAAEQAATDERLHDWRKQVKDHWYHTLLLRAVWPEAFKARARLLKELSELLGQDQDLALLQDLLKAEPGLFGTAGQRTELTSVVEQRRGWLQQRAFSLGKRIYAEGASPLCERWSLYWRIARRE
ncbi:MAG: CHAD domain-containing protein [Pseudomonadaceae bacterium]|nr:CHAD domain-containing protein [Pseudomonas sp.]